MTVEKILAEARQNDIEIHIEDGGLMCTGPWGMLYALLPAVQAHRFELRAWLEAHPQAEPREGSQ